MQRFEGPILTSAKQTQFFMPTIQKTTAFSKVQMKNQKGVNKGEQEKGKQSTD